MQITRGRSKTLRRYVSRRIEVEWLGEEQLSCVGKFEAGSVWLLSDVAIWLVTFI